MSLYIIGYVVFFAALFDMGMRDAKTSELKTLFFTLFFALLWPVLIGLWLSKYFEKFVREEHKLSRSKKYKGEK